MPTVPITPMRPVRVTLAAARRPGSITPTTGIVEPLAAARRARPRPRCCTRPRAAFTSRSSEHVGDLERVLQHLVARLRPVREPAGVAEVDDALVGQQVDERAEHGEPAEPGVEHADRRASRSSCAPGGAGAAGRPPRRRSRSVGRRDREHHVEPLRRRRRAAAVQRRARTRRRRPARRRRPRPAGRSSRQLRREHADRARRARASRSRARDERRSRRRPRPRARARSATPACPARAPRRRSRSGTARPSSVLDPLARDAAEPQDRGLGAASSRRWSTPRRRGTDRRRAHVDVVAEVGAHVGGGGRAHPPEPVGRRRGDPAAERARAARARRGWSGTRSADGVEPAGDRVGHRAARGAARA